MSLSFLKRSSPKKGESLALVLLEADGGVQALRIRKPSVSTERLFVPFTSEGISEFR